MSKLNPKYALAKRALSLSKYDITESNLNYKLNTHAIFGKSVFPKADFGFNNDVDSFL